MSEGVKVQSKRKSYTLEQKLHVAKQVKQGENGFGYNSIAKKFGLPQSSVKRWFYSIEDLEKQRQNREICMKKTRYLPGNGRKTPFQDLEEILAAWVLDQNAKGLTLKDKYLISKALSIKEELLQQRDEPDEVLIEFKASPGKLFSLISNFINRQPTLF
jgi:hypothetical protein